MMVMVVQVRRVQVLALVQMVVMHAVVVRVVVVVTVQELVVVRVLAKMAAVWSLRTSMLQYPVSLVVALQGVRTHMAAAAPLP